ncbi:tRNA threonylcarbamoyl adenosine modification protein YeaZ [Friedmanniella endophytica]|uniref:tRNA threonylcarbamoyl adenosine modification protein YeaZ n=1 Tax=Microlunatus kandeliicorticis TaxID=1759536 RepID=A0A7W3P4U7_9ACTN|nr:tRNA (adenosine(37)-N6)-threonylcarbamoyltransferase complex dimerization subunit type 1 TsaB [Microlunatus kandeliicorticis]MBA8793185.1 tRNA threonylcarbamoyl adenosine modification protein YeaZ [Microlunatus kandeliicorticis]
MSEQTPTEPLTLAIDTSTDVVVGLAGGEAVVAEHRNADARRHVEDLMPSVITLLGGAGVARTTLDAVVVGMGPGPFTGLRVGIATARVLADTLRIPLRAVCGLDAVAADWVHGANPPDGDFLVVADARRREVYWARYDATGRRQDGPSVSAPTGLPALPLAGPGHRLCPDHRLGTGAPERLDGGALARWGGGLPEVGDEPLYLRRPDAAVPTRRKSVLAARTGHR